MIVIFLDQTVNNKILAFEGNGVVEGYIGGYSDYLEAKLLRHPSPDTFIREKIRYYFPIKTTRFIKNRQNSVINFYELEQLPAKIENLATEIKELELQ